MGAERWDEQVGSVADEAGRLLESLRRSAEAAAAAAAASPATDPHPTTAGGTPDGAGAPPASEQHDHEHASPLGGGEHDPVCQWCPICRGAAVVRSLSPETLTRLADLASVAAGVLTDLAGARASADPSAGTAPATRPPTPAATSRPIPVRDADDPQEAPRG